MFLRHALLAVSIGSLIPLAATATAAATVGGAVPPVASATVVAASSYRIDRQTPPASAVFTGVSNKTSVRVDWGDGTPAQTRKGTCSTASAAAHRTGCVVTMRHGYGKVGAFTITASSGAKSASKAVAVMPAPWRRPAGWVQPAGWQAVVGGTYAPCTGVNWYFDHSGEPADRVGAVNDVMAALAQLEGQTGLRFTPAASADEAAMTFRWQSMPGLDTGLVTVNPVDETAVVRISSDDPYTRDEFGGLGTHDVLITDKNGQHEQVIPGRGWVFVQLAMQALGMWTVPDSNEVMYTGYIGPGAFGPGDLDGLHTMYLSQPCPSAG